MEVIKARNVNHPDHTQNLNSEKYNLIREAMLASLPAYDSGESMSFLELEDRVRAYLEERRFRRLYFQSPVPCAGIRKRCSLTWKPKMKLSVCTMSLPCVYASWRLAKSMLPVPMPYITTVILLKYS